MVEENEYIEKGKDSEEKEMTAKGSKKSKKGKSKRKKDQEPSNYPSSIKSEINLLIERLEQPLE